MFPKRRTRSTKLVDILAFRIHLYSRIYHALLILRIYKRFCQLGYYPIIFSINEKLVDGERRNKIYIYIFFAEKYTRIGVILIIFSSVWFHPRERGRGKRSRLRRKLQPASININSAAWKGRESYTLELGRLWSSLRSLSPTAGYVSDGQVARGGATGLEETKGARESDRKAERGRERMVDTTFRQTRKRFYLFGSSAIASGEKESRARGVDSLIRQLGGRGGVSRFDPFNRR